MSSEHKEFLMFMTTTQIAGLLYDQTEQESISEAFVPVVGKFHQKQDHYNERKFFLKWRIQRIVWFDLNCWACSIVSLHVSSPIQVSTTD